MDTMTIPRGSVVPHLTAAAHRAADVLVDHAITIDGRSTWLGATIEAVDGEFAAVNRTGDPSFYDGSAGIALACASVARSLGRDDLADLARSAARHALDGASRLDGDGLFDGRAGIAHAAHEVGRLIADDALAEAGLHLLATAAASTSEQLDLISGSAGTILALLAAHCATGGAEWLVLATHHGDHLLATAEHHPWGTAWPMPGAAGPSLCGLAHGAAGFAWALAALAAATPTTDRFATAADAARRYERSWFDAAAGGWPDLRDHDPQTATHHAPCPAFWCHGATGIGLSRLALQDLAPHPSLVADSAAALHATSTAATASLAGVPTEGLSLCHGLGGSALLFVAAHRTLGPLEHLYAAQWLTVRALGRLGDDPATWPSGVPNGGFSPSLMSGLAGAMYALCRVADPATTPEIAVLGG